MKAPRRLATPDEKGPRPTRIMFSVNWSTHRYPAVSGDVEMTMSIPVYIDTAHKGRTFWNWDWEALKNLIPEHIYEVYNDLVSVQINDEHKVKGMVDSVKDVFFEEMEGGDMNLHWRLAF